MVSFSGAALAQSSAPEADTRAAQIVTAQQQKAHELKVYEPNKAEVWVKKLEEQFLTGSLHWHPFFDSAYSGGGFTLGAGYARYVSAYNTIDLRGSVTPSGYLRFETEFRAPRVFNRRGVLSVLGGWREATQVGFYGFGTDPTSKDDRANYGFRQPYVSATLDMRPKRNWIVLGGGVDYSQWDQRPGEGDQPSVEEVYTPAALPGLGAKVTYLHAQGTAAADTRPAAGYARRGGYYGVTVHGYADTDETYGFRQVEYEAIQHVPLFRDAWVLSFRGKVDTTFAATTRRSPSSCCRHSAADSSLRGFTSWRFRDRNSILLQAEWRVLVNSFFDTAVFADAGKVTSRTSIST